MRRRSAGIRAAVGVALAPGNLPHVSPGTILGTVIGVLPAGKVRGPMRLSPPSVIPLDRPGGAVYSGPTARGAGAAPGRMAGGSFRHSSRLGGLP